jgi:class 3 adenylate cyclase
MLAADVAGYSRLMGADEEGTLDRLNAHRRELIDPKIVEHHSSTDTPSSPMSKTPHVVPSEFVPAGTVTFLFADIEGGARAS